MSLNVFTPELIEKSLVEAELVYEKIFRDNPEGGHMDAVALLRMVGIHILAMDLAALKESYKDANLEDHVHILSRAIQIAADGIIMQVNKHSKNNVQ